MADEQGLEQRVEMLERVILAMCSGQHFTIQIDERGRPQLFTELPAGAVPYSCSVRIPTG